MPATVLLNYKDGVYAIDSYSPEYDDPDKNVLTWLVSNFFFLAVITMGPDCREGNFTRELLDSRTRRLPKILAIGIL